jgi:trigger factor
LKIETVALDDQQTKLIAEFDSDTLEKYKRQAARKISQSQKIPGFRPGKAPYDLVRRMIGDEALQQEAIEIMLEDVYPQVLREANINPSGPGKLEEIIKMDPPTLAFIIPLPPVVELGDYQAVRKEYAPEPVGEEQINATLRRLQRSYATAEPVERAAQKGDLVAFKLSAKRTQPEEGENEMLIEETPYQLVAGEPEEEEASSWPYEGFENELLGLSANDTKTVVHTFSDDSPYEELRGKEAEFSIEVQNVKEMHLPELNDEFAQMLGDFENLEALRKAVQTQLEQTSSQQYNQNYYDELIGMLVDQATIKYPPHMLEEEIEDFIHGLEHNLEHDHLDLETYLKMREMDRETFIENEVKPAAMRRLERSLVMEEFARQEQISVRNEEIQSIYETALQQMQASKQLRKAQAKNRQTPRDMANNIAINTVNNIFNQRLMSRLKAIATGAGDELPAETESVVAESETVEAAEAVEASAASVESPSEPVATEPEAAPQTDEEAGESQA